MKKLIFISTIFMALTAFGQKKTSGPPAALFACWAASYEENKENNQEKLYRPCDYNFPPSRFRQNIIFEKNGTCKVLAVGETDIHYFVDCKWVYDKKKKLVNVYDDKGKVKMKLKIISADKELLKVLFVD